MHYCCQGEDYRANDVSQWLLVFLDEPGNYCVLKYWPLSVLQFMKMRVHRYCWCLLFMIAFCHYLYIITTFGEFSTHYNILILILQTFDEKLWWKLYRCCIKICLRSIQTQATKKFYFLIWFLCCVFFYLTNSSDFWNSVFGLFQYHGSTTCCHNTQYA